MKRLLRGWALIGAFSAVTALGMSVVNAASFERFTAWSAALSANPNGAGARSLFQYYAPQAGLRDADISELVRISADYRFLRSMVDAGLDQSTQRLTGIDFSTVRAGMVSITEAGILHAIDVADIDLKQVETAYSARGFKTSEVEGRTVLHLGEDGTWDTARVDLSDPFEIGLGDAQRIGLVGDTVIVGPGWNVVRMIMRELDGGNDCTACLPWRNMANALRTVAGEGVHLDYASGWPGRFAFEGSDMTGLRADSSDLPDFSLAMLAITAEDDKYTPHIVVHFSSLADAKAGAAEIAQRAGGIALSSSVGYSHLPQTTAVYEVEDGTVAVVTFDTGDLETVYRRLGEWELSIQSSSFPPLARR